MRPTWTVMSSTGGLNHPKERLRSARESMRLRHGFTPTKSEIRRLAEPEGGAGLGDDTFREVRFLSADISTDDR
jgi:hypothetical protein